MNIECKLIENDTELDAAHAIRHEVFIIEQDVPHEIEWDEFEDTALHMICLLDNKAVGTGRISFFGENETEVEKVAKVERVAVLKQHRNKGIGTIITKFLIDECKKRNAKTIYAHVQLHAKAFYDKMGFKGVGEIFDEAGIDHIKMILG
jgi:predicted GNAT family N-acyltransferase